MFGLEKSLQSRPSSPTISSTSLKSVVSIGTGVVYCQDSLTESLRMRRQEEADRKDIAEAYFKATYYAQNKETLWTACRTVIGGMAIMVLGLVMTIMGYFDRDLATTTFLNSTTGSGHTIVDNSLRYKLKSMQYIGPVLMGCGMFLLIIACVITLESRDRHAQVIHETWTSGQAKKVLLQRQKQVSQNDQQQKRSLLTGTAHPENAGMLFRSHPNGKLQDDAGGSRNNVLIDKPEERPSCSSEVETKSRWHQKDSIADATDNSDPDTLAFAPTLPTYPTINMRKEEAAPSITEIKVNRSLPRGQAPLVKVESLSTSLMTLPSSSPRVPATTDQPSTSPNR